MCRRPDRGSSAAGPPVAVEDADAVLVEALTFVLPRIQRVAALLVGDRAAADDLVAGAVARTLPRWRRRRLAQTRDHAVSTGSEVLLLGSYSDLAGGSSFLVDATGSGDGELPPEAPADG